MLNHFKFQKGKTSQRVQILLESATANTAKTALAYNTVSLVCYYFRDGDSAPTQITLVDGVSVGHAFTSGGFIKISDTLLPGMYEFGIPDAVLASGANWAWIAFFGSAGFTTVSPQVFIELTDHDPVADIALIKSYIDTEVAAIKAKTDNLPSDPADASDIAASFSTVNSTLATIAAYIDTEVAAIKAKTDQLAFTAGKVNAHVGSSSVETGGGRTGGQ